jgi:HEPN domain-containing protein
MTQEEIIAYWVKSSERDWKAARDLASAGNRVQALFFAHLVIEKLLKACWVKENKADLPPRTHNLEYLLAQTGLSMPVDDIDELRIMTAWNIEGRYQDYKDLIFKATTQEYVESKFEIVNRIRTWLIEQLQ